MLNYLYLSSSIFLNCYEYFNYKNIQVNNATNTVTIILHSNKYFGLSQVLSRFDSTFSFYIHYHLNFISLIFEWLQYHPCDLFLRVGQESNQTHVSTYQK